MLKYQILNTWTLYVFLCFVTLLSRISASWIVWINAKLNCFRENGEFCDVKFISYKGKEHRWLHSTSFGNLNPCLIVYIQNSAPYHHFSVFDAQLSLRHAQKDEPESFLLPTLQVYLTILKLEMKKSFMKLCISAKERS